jgi:HSP20 family protein
MSTSLVPFGLTHDLRREFDGLMQRFFQNEEPRDVVVWAPRLNLSETDQKYEVSLDLPGMKPENIDIELKQGELWITGTRQGEKEENGKAWHRVERFYGEFRRVVRLGEDVDPENITAEYNDGVLTVSVPKTELARTRKIAVKSKA